MMSGEYIAILELSGQVTEDRYRVFPHYMHCGPETTVGEIMSWVKTKGKNRMHIGVTIAELDKP